MPPTARQKMGGLASPGGLAWLALLLLAALPYLNGLGGGFVYDDGGVILSNPHLAPEQPWWRALATPYWPPPQDAGLYRPLTTLTFKLQRALHGPAPWPFHALNVLLHAAVCLLVYAVARRLPGVGRGIAWAAAALFAVHPLHCESVTGIVGRAELLAALFGLLAYRAYLAPESRARLLQIGLGMALAIASKEGAVGWFLLLGAHRAGWLGDQRGYRRLAVTNRLGAEVRADLAWIVGALPYLLARGAVLGWQIQTHPTLIDNPLVGADAGTRLLTAGKVLLHGWLLTLWPARLSADYSYNAIPLETSLVGLGGLALPLLLAGIALAIRYRSRFPGHAWALAFYLAMLLPVSNLLVPIGTIFGERLLYLPSFGLLLLLTLALGRWRIAPLLLAAALLAGGLRTAARNRDWVDDHALFSAGVAAYPASARLQANLGTTLAARGDLEDAETHLRASLAIAPGNSKALNGLGHVLILTGRHDEAERILQDATERYARDPEPWQRLGNLYLELGRGADALAAFDRQLALVPDSPAGWIGRASALFLLERFPESASAWERAVRLSGPEQDLRRHHAVALIRAGRQQEAIDLLRVLAREEPADAVLQHELARLLLEVDPAHPAGLESARRAVAIAPSGKHCGTLLDHLLARDDCAAARTFLQGDAVAALPDSVRAQLRRRAVECVDP